MQRWISIADRLISALWVGALWAIGYLAVPVLFHSLDDRRLAGELAGHMFSSLNIIGLVSGALLLAAAVWTGGERRFRQRRVWVLAVMIALVCVNAFGLQPVMQLLKADGLEPGSAEAARFSVLHGISSVLYLILSLCGLYLVAAPAGVKSPGAAREGS